MHTTLVSEPLAPQTDEQRKLGVNMKFKEWITVAGVLNHAKWTQYFGDMPFPESLDMETLPNIKQKHFVGGKDNVVPYNLAKQWANQQDIILIKNATHNNFGEIDLFK